MSNQSFSVILYTLRKNRNLSQQQLAKESGIRYGVIKKWERDSTKPNVDNLIKLAKYFDVSTDYLLGLTRTPFENAVSVAGLKQSDIRAVNSLIDHYRRENSDEQD